jgi:hypothetical protein
VRDRAGHLAIGGPKATLALRCREDLIHTGTVGLDISGGRSRRCAKRRLKMVRSTAMKNKLKQTAARQ